MNNQTHVEVAKDFRLPTNRTNLNSDDIGYVESYDFSTANSSHEARIAAISTIASVCYGNPKASGSISLYNRLANESAGLPSSSFEFVPVLLHTETIHNGALVNPYVSACIKYGEYVEEHSYILTNLRALISDVGEQADQFFNTPEECGIIAKHFKVFKAKIDLATRAQFIRHRVSWQELSRRYVSGKKSEFEFYISPKMRDMESKNYWEINGDDGYDKYKTEELISLCINHYNESIANGVKPEEARRCLPQSMYTTLWSAWQPSQLENMLKLRTDSHAQSEIQELAFAIQNMTR